MRISKVYTRGGDRGTTGLVDGSRVRKDSERVEAYGEVDELGAQLGAALVPLGTDPLAAQVRELQNDLFILACDLASPGQAQVPRITADHTRRLEAWIDEGVEEVGPLEEFVLRGGSPAGSALHVACTVCRRAERRAFRTPLHWPASESEPPWARFRERRAPHTNMCIIVLTFREPRATIGA